MATPIPLPSKVEAPVTPPPEFMFMKGRPQIPGPFSQGLHHQTTPPTSTSTLPQETPPQIQPNQTSILSNTTDPTLPQPPLHNIINSTNNNPQTTPTPVLAPAAEPPFGPQHLAIASRIASYYQQRSQALATLQQQRCQAWAARQRQQCQAVMQAATVVVAWYMRDRIVRRRRRKGRGFQRGLEARDRGLRSGGRVAKGEAVRRWVLGVPSARECGMGGGGDSGRELPRDREEVEFDVDRELAAKDGDARLFEVADNIIKSHLARADVPLLGALSFEESESGSESDEEGGEELMDYEDGEGEEYEEEYEEEGDGGEMDEKERVDDGEARGHGSGDVGKGELASGSKDAQLGTTIMGSRKRSQSPIS
ncbi:hypothetical protein C8A01DRAFT_43386 [Parachaetomium inaequale]|uniref:Uncharacterized protein n=1 Tax=Parachaetomium inaequale TaxID=2588326 RepID=A0AAN6SVI9_9PEZI|nr:hypothetical protein C8A01DRAFT_43386 [Parachaetomium inaequale]